MLGLEIAQLAQEAHALEVFVFGDGGEVGSAGGRAGGGAPDAAEVGVAEFGFAARGGGVVVGGDLGGAVDVAVVVVAGRVDLVVDFVGFEGGAKGRGDGSWEAIAFVAVVEDVEEGEGGGFGERWGGVRVDEVPGGGYVGVGDGEGGVEGLEG